MGAHPAEQQPEEIRGAEGGASLIDVHVGRQLARELGERDVVGGAELAVRSAIPDLDEHLRVARLVEAVGDVLIEKRLHAGLHRHLIGIDGEHRGGCGVGGVRNAGQRLVRHGGEGE